MSPVARYSSLQIGLHWLIAVLIGVNWLTGEAMIEAFDGMIKGEAGKAGLASASHVWFGIAIIALTLIRLVIRARVGVPPKASHGLLDRVGELGHWALYALMLAVPGLGAVAWFKGLENIGDLHVLVMNAMMILILVHAAAGILHHFVLKDGLLARIVPGLKA